MVRGAGRGLLFRENRAIVDGGCEGDGGEYSRTAVVVDAVEECQWRRKALVKSEKKRKKEAGRGE